MLGTVREAYIPHTDGRGSGLPFEVLQEWLQFPYEYFLLVLQFFPLRVTYCFKLCPSDRPRKKITNIKNG
jgi:hypothetical protein